MIGRVYHVGLTVSDLDRSVSFYQDILGLAYLGEIWMDGKETEALFGRKDCKARVAYLNGSDKENMPPVELIQFVSPDAKKHSADLFTTSVSELCFYTDDIDEAYGRLREHHVKCLSGPRDFDFTDAGFGKSRAFYFRDPDGIILEMMQPIG